MAERVAFHVLGPLVVEGVRGRAAIAAHKQRALLATLLLHPNEVVDSERIVDGVWGPAPPASAPHLVQVYVSQLRRSLEEAGLPDRIHTEPNGYRIAVEAGELDSERFEEYLGAGTRALAAGDAAAAIGELRGALSLWSGNALADVELDDEPSLRVARLEELRLVATEHLVEARIAAGESGALVPELERLVATHPLREAFRAQLMLCLYRSGRQADALAAYQEGRRVLVEELGLEPGRRLRELEAAILRHDPALEPNDAPAASPSPVRAAGTSRRAKRRRRAAVVAAASLVVVAVAVGLTVATRRHGGAGVGVLPHAVAVLSEKDNSVAASRRVGASPGRVAYGAGGLWVGDLDDHTLSLVDPLTLRRERVVGLPETPSTLQTSAAVVWLGYGYSGRVGRYLTRTGTLTRPVRPTPTAIGLAAIAPTERDVWLGLQDGAVLGLDPVSLRVKTAARIGSFFRLVGTPQGVWGIGFRRHDVVRIDQLRGRVAGRTPVDGAPQALAAGRGSIWVATSGPNLLQRIDPRNGQVVSTTPLGIEPSTIAVGRDAVWVASGLTGELERVDPARAELVATVRLGRPILSLAADGDGRLFVAVG